MSFDFLSTDTSVDLTNCDREPIHVPGSIQPSGILLSFDADSLKLRYWSDNLFQGAVGAPDEAEELSLEEVFGQGMANDLVAHVLNGPAGVSHAIQASLFGQSHTYDGAAHHFKEALIVELELAEGVTPDVLPRSEVHVLSRWLRSATSAMQSTTSLNELYQTIADQVRNITGFDRVMVYEFAPDLHGVVVAETREESLESFLGLHYPSTDIPAQARKLYTLNWLRLIPDVRAMPVRLMTWQSDKGPESLDLTYSVYRSVSPIHIEYLINMGVQASMSVSLIREGELFGLIACHHYSARCLSLELRHACEAFGSVASAYVSARRGAGLADERRARQEALSEAYRLAAAGPTFSEGIRDAAEHLIRALDADGLAYTDGDRIELYGQTPPGHVIPEIVERLKDRMIDGRFATVSLTDISPDFAQLAPDACGVAAMRCGPDSSDHLLLFREEYVQEITWAGEPVKSTDPDQALTPRASFDAWRQSVELQSREWSPVDQRVLTEMQAGLAILVGRRLAEMERINNELRRLNEDLESFTYAASHDLKEPLRGINQTLFFLKEALSQRDTDGAERRMSTLEQTTKRMEELISGMLRLSRVGRSELEIESFPLEDVVNEAKLMVLHERRETEVEVVVHALPTVRGDRSLLRDVFQNLISNAIKYNLQDRPRIEVTDASELAGKKESHVISVTDNGIGIAEHQSDEVFQIFRRLHLPEEHGGGTGVGLTICRRIIERHGGRMWVESAGDGSTFYLSIGEPDDQGERV